MFWVRFRVCKPVLTGNPLSALVQIAAIAEDLEITLSLEKTKDVTEGYHIAASFGFVDSSA